MDENMMMDPSFFQNQMYQGGVDLSALGGAMFQNPPIGDLSAIGGGAMFQNQYQSPVDLSAEGLGGGAMMGFQNPINQQADVYVHSPRDYGGGGGPVFGQDQLPPPDGGYYLQGERQDPAAYYWNEEQAPLQDQQDVFAYEEQKIEPEGGEGQEGIEQDNNQDEYQRRQKRGFRPRQQPQRSFPQVARGSQQHRGGPYFSPQGLGQMSYSIQHPQFAPSSSPQLPVMEGRLISTPYPQLARPSSPQAPAPVMGRLISTPPPALMYSHSPSPSQSFPPASPPQTQQSVEQITLTKQPAPIPLAAKPRLSLLYYLFRYRYFRILSGIILISALIMISTTVICNTSAKGYECSGTNQLCSRVTRYEAGMLVLGPCGGGYCSAFGCGQGLTPQCATVTFNCDFTGISVTCPTATRYCQPGWNAIKAISATFFSISCLWLIIWTLVLKCNQQFPEKLIWIYESNYCPWGCCRSIMGQPISRS